MLTEYLNAHSRKAAIISALLQKENTKTKKELEKLIRQIFSEYEIYEINYPFSNWNDIANRIRPEKPEAAHLIKEALMQLYEAGENS